MRRRAKQEALEAHHNAEVVHSLVHHCLYKVAAPAAENEERETGEVERLILRLIRGRLLLGLHPSRGTSLRARAHSHFA